MPRGCISNRIRPGSQLLSFPAQNTVEDVLHLDGQLKSRRFNVAEEDRGHGPATIPRHLPARVVLQPDLSPLKG